MVVLNVVCGLIMFEYAWAASKIHRLADEERDRPFPAWRRHDAPKWQKWKMYPMAVTFMPVRTTCYTIALCAINFVHYFLMHNVDLSKPIP